MTEPNIVYIGDEVRFGGDSDSVAWVICGSPHAITMIDKDAYPHAASFCLLTTPDGRPVDGFGGAKIEFDEESECFLIGGVELSQLDAPETGYAADDYERDAAFQRALSCAIRLCGDLYGEWVREPTEADLKRRGLL